MKYRCPECFEFVIYDHIFKLYDCPSCGKKGLENDQVLTENYEVVE